MDMNKTYAVWRNSLVGYDRSGDFIMTTHSEDEAINRAIEASKKITPLEYIEIRVVTLRENKPTVVTTNYKRYLIGSKEVPENMSNTDIINSIIFNF